ncbi:MAG: 6-bladed beta-propeller, partial [Gemmatimonadota bacterium]
MSSRRRPSATPQRRASTACAGALIIVFACCAPETDRSVWAGTMTDSAGITVVSNPDVGLWTDVEAWTVEEDLRIGALGGDPDYQFGQVGSIALNSSGEIFVSDRQAREVRVFSPTGELLRTVGAPGSGPGEFGRGPLDVMISAGDTLLVPDVRNRRIHRFAPDGTFLDSAPIDLERGRPLRFGWNAASNGM